MIHFGKGDMDMNADRIQRIYALLAKIPVLGDSVDLMAQVRAELRSLYAEATTHKEVSEDGGQANRRPATGRTHQDE